MSVLAHYLKYLIEVVVMISFLSYFLTFPARIINYPCGASQRGLSTCRTIRCIGLLLITLQWRHNGRDGVSYHQPIDYLLNRLFRYRWKKSWKLRVTGLREGNWPVTDEFFSQRANNAENVSNWWRHHELCLNQQWHSDENSGFAYLYFDYIFLLYH